MMGNLFQSKTEKKNGWLMGADGSDLGISPYELEPAEDDQKLLDKVPSL